MRILIEEYPGSVDAARFLIAARDAGVPGPRLPADCRPQTQARPSPCNAAPPACCAKRGATTSPPGRARYPRPKNPWWLPSTHPPSISAPPRQYPRRAPSCASNPRSPSNWRAICRREHSPTVKPRSMPPSAAPAGAGSAGVPLCAAGARQPARAAGRPHVQPGPGAGTAHRVRRRRARQHDHHAVRGRPGCRAARGHPSQRPAQGRSVLAGELPA